MESLVKYFLVVSMTVFLGFGSVNGYTLSDSSCDVYNACPPNYYPVCGASDGGYKTYQNVCFLQKEICETSQNILIIKHGPCF